jgi:hypothetical protein
MSDQRINLAELREKLEPKWKTARDGEPVSLWFGGARETAVLLRGLVDASYALEELLDVAERIRMGDPNLDPERWYAARDYARVALSRFDFGEPSP